MKKFIVAASLITSLFASSAHALVFGILPYGLAIEAPYAMITGRSLVFGDDMSECWGSSNPNCHRNAKIYRHVVGAGITAMYVGFTLSILNAETGEIRGVDGAVFFLPVESNSTSEQILTEAPFLLPVHAREIQSAIQDKLEAGEVVRTGKIIDEVGEVVQVHFSEEETKQILASGNYSAEEEASVINLLK